jgi:tol-pal system protein YbgF
MPARLVAREPEAEAEPSGSSDPAPAEKQTAALPPEALGGTLLPSGAGLDQYDRAMGLLRDGRYDEAETTLREFLARSPGSRMAPNAQYWLGEVYWQRNQFDKAAIAFSDAYRKYPNGAKAPDALMKSAIALGNVGRRDDACAAFREFGQRFPGATGYSGDRVARERQRFGC